MGGMANCKPLDKSDSFCLERLYLEKLKITFLGSRPTLLTLYFIMLILKVYLAIFQHEIKG